MSEPYDTLKKLRDEVEDILVKARDAKIEGAINWGDLHVRDVSFCDYRQSLDGGTYYLVLIEEAAPDNHELHEYIRQNITVLQASDIVKIETEW